MLPGTAKGANMTTTIQTVINEQHGFIKQSDLPGIIEQDRLMPCVIRCGGGRFTCPAQDVEHFIAIIERDGQDYIRDVSISVAYLRR